MEPKAREKYEEAQNAKVLECGLVVCPEQPWLACSPDGVILDSLGRPIVLEIKCPIRCQDDLILVNYISDGELKKSHEYYFQVQLQMYLCKADMCHFFVFSMADSKLIKIPFDKDFI